MRNVLVIELNTPRANDAARAGKLGDTIGAILQEQAPEAVYFTEIDGARTAIMVVDVPTAADIPRLAEPWFLAFDAKVGFHPAMGVEDLQKAGPDIAAAVAAYG